LGTVISMVRASEDGCDAVVCADKCPQKVQAARESGRSRWNVIQEYDLGTEEMGSSYQ
jgi:hypothetical protein